MSQPRVSDVVVAGAGPVGLFAALCLSRRGLGVRLVEEGWRETARSYALALHPGSLRLLAAEGLADVVLSRGQRVSTLAFYEGAARRLEIPVSSLCADFPFVLVLPQAELERTLGEALQARGVSVEWNHRVAGLTPDADGVDLAVQRLEKTSAGYAVATTEWVVDSVEHARARVVVGADGHRSTVRRNLGIGFESLAEPDLYAVFEFAGEAGVPRDEVRVVLDEAGASVLWPLPGGAWRWSFALHDIGVPSAWREKSRLAVPVGSQLFDPLGPEAFEQLARQHAPWFTARPQDLRWSLLVRFERRLAAAFGRGRVWLAGDAAHLAGPIGVHSMNGGLREVADLCARIEEVLRGDAGTAPLQAYGEHWHREWSELLSAPAAPKGSGWVGAHAAAILGAVPVSGAERERLAAQLPGWSASA